MRLARQDSPLSERPFKQRTIFILTAALLATVATLPASGDWLITEEGDRIETDGPWLIDQDRVRYLGTDGEIAWLPLADVDLRASAEATEADRPKITLYMTSWCGYCRKTRQLLTRLGVDFAEKDIEKSVTAQREFLERGRGHGGVPLLDIDGKIVRGYNQELIVKLVGELREKEAAESS